MQQRTARVLRYGPRAIIGDTVFHMGIRVSIDYKYGTQRALYLLVWIVYLVGFL